MVNGAVYVQTNESSNRVVAFRRAEDGTLSELGTYHAGGAGDGQPHLTSQGSVALSSDGGYLLVTNAASDDVTVFAVGSGGDLERIGSAPAGPAPKSVTERGGLVYLLATGSPAVTGFRLGADGLESIAGAEQALSPDADPAQVGFTPDGSALVVTERGTDSISAIPVQADGTPNTRQTVASSGPTPYGFVLTSNGTLVVTEAFRSVTPDGRHAFTTNFADGAVSPYAIAEDGGLTLEEATAAFSVDGRPGLRDEGLSADGRYLYAIDADSGSLFGWQVGEGGALTNAGDWAGLPSTVAGLACR